MVIAGLQSINDRKTEAQKLLDWGFGQFKVVNLYGAGDTVSRARIWGGSENWVNLVVHDEMKVAISPKELDGAEIKMSYSGPLLAPVKAGQIVGTVRLLIDGKPVTEVPLETANDVSAVSSMWKKAWDSVLIMAFGG